MNPMRESYRFAAGQAILLSSPRFAAPEADDRSL